MVIISLCRLKLNDLNAAHIGALKQNQISDITINSILNRQGQIRDICESTQKQRTNQVTFC